MPGAARWIQPYGDTGSKWSEIFLRGGRDVILLNAG